MAGELRSISVLCDLIKLCVDFEIDITFFKQARKDEQKIVQKFWLLLNKFPENNITQDVVDNVKIYFASQNYRNIEFYSLPGDFTSGSRELLIAFSWLLSNDDIFNNLLKKKILDSNLSQEFDICDREPFQNIDIKLKSVQDHQNYILSLCGKINTNLKTISEYQMKTVDLLGKVHSISNELSLSEIYHLKNAGNLNIYMQKVKSISNLLEIYQKWKDIQSCYWQFMLSVLEKKSQRNKELEIDKTNLMLFFTSLRNYVKKLLKEEHETKQKIHDEFFPRCVVVKNSSSCTKAIENLENYLKSVQNEERQNLKSVYRYLKNMF